MFATKPMGDKKKKINFFFGGQPDRSREGRPRVRRFLLYV
jgi:hypothetical protein